MTRRILLIAALALSACARSNSAVHEATVEEVSQWVKTGSATVFDANNEDFRQKNGTVPGAVLLDNYKSYDVSVLGQDKGRQLVFYCTNRL
jgi:hypothetical protein